MSGTPNYPGDIGEVIRRIDARVRDLQTAQATRRAFDKISANVVELLGRLVVKAGGVLEVQNAAGSGLMYVGQILLSDASYADGIAVFRPSGDVAFASYQTSGGFVTVVYDLATNRLVQADEAAGQGLARPWLLSAMYPARAGEMYPTTNATFETLYRGQLQKQHARLTLTGQAYADTATTGEIRVLVNGVQLGATLTVAAFSFTDFSIGPAAVAGAHMQLLNVELQARRTGGAGNVRCSPLMLEAVQS